MIIARRGLKVKVIGQGPRWGYKVEQSVALRGQSDLDPLVFTARRYASAVYAMALCLPVCVCLCLSLVGVLLKRLNTGSHKQNHAIAQGL